MDSREERARLGEEVRAGWPWIGVPRLAGLLALGVLLPACGISGNGTLIPTVAPQVPTGLAGIAAPLRVALSWRPSPAATSYTLKRSPTRGGPYAPVPQGSGLTTLSFVDGGLVDGKAYYYVVSAVNSFGESADSTELRVVPFLNAVQVSAGRISETSLALLKDGSLWGWGDNNNRVLGSSTANSLSTFALEIPVPFTHPILSISNSGWHALALLSDGSVWAWGNNQYGQLGNGTIATSAPYALASMAQVPGLSGMVAIAAGETHSLALKSDGTVWAWGSNQYGQLGNGAVTTGNPSNLGSPVQVTGLSGVTAISVGRYHSLALRPDGTVWAWGYNQYGQLGNGSAAGSLYGLSTPGMVTGLGGVVEIAAGALFSLALDQDGTVWGWGDGGNGELGSSSGSSVLAIKVPGLSSVTAIFAGNFHGAAIQADGTFWGWGYNNSGQLGNGTASLIPVTPPVQIASLTGLATVSAGGFFTLALKTDGTVWGWGADGSGELGNGGGSVQPVPVVIPDVTGIVGVAVGNSYSMALDSIGRVWTWGDNSSGQLGVSSVSQSVYALLVTGVGGIKSIAAGAVHSLAVDSAGAVWSWGDNFSGQLGNGSTSGAALVGISTPAKVAIPTAVAVAGGESHTLALTSAGTVWAWGSNQFGQIGIGTFTPTAPYANPSPVQVSTITGITAIAAGAGHSLALKSDGTVWAWGVNTSGELGNGTTTPTSMPPYGVSTPGQVSTITGITAIAAGSDHSLALKSDGTVWAWGYNLEGQIGNGVASGVAVNSPVQVPGLSGVAAIAAGFDSSYALKADGTLWVWGSNSSGALGNGSTINTSSPVQSPYLSGLTAISSGCVSTTCLAIQSNQQCIGWGLNGSGQLSRVPTGGSAVPIEITR